MISGFTVHKLEKKPIEDFYSIDKTSGVIAVADGVTRDWDELLRDNKKSNYPNPSPAGIASKLFCKIFQLHLKKCKNVSEKTIKEAFEKANKEIAKWNSNNIPNVDYVMNDFAGCVASGVVKREGLVYFGYLTDCGVAIVDKGGKLKFRTEDEGPNKHDKYIWRDDRLRGREWTNPTIRRIIRSEYRNNSSNKHSFGVLTGEKSAMDYIRVGKQKIQKGDYLLVYSDGVENIIFSDGGEINLKVRNLLTAGDLKGLERLCREGVQTEGTLVILRNE